MSDDEIIRFAAEFRRGILGRRGSALMCFAVCAPLVTLLSMSGVEGEVVKTDAPTPDHANHYWIKLADGRALDPTADQFNRWREDKLPRVYLGKPLDIHA